MGKKAIFRRAAEAAGAVAMGLALVFCVTGGTMELHSGDGDVAGAEYVETAATLGEEDVVVRQGNTESEQLAFTCNVDWGEEVLPDMLQVLEEKEVRLTFFVSGKWAKRHPELLREMYLDGHSIQSHGYAHRMCSEISRKEVRQEIQTTEAAVREILGTDTTIFAPPSGDYDEKTVEVCRELGYVLSLWSSDTIDWREGSTAAVITERILSNPLSGAIVLMHPKVETVKALPGLIDEIRNRGITVVTLEELLEPEQKKKAALEAPPQETELVKSR